MRTVSRIPLLLALALSTSLTMAGSQRFADSYATSGSGTSASPWKGWESAIVTDAEIVFIKGYYETPTTKITIPSNTVLTGVDGAIVQWPATRSTIDSMFYIAPGTENVVIRDLQFEAGVSVPAIGLSSGGGGTMIRIGSAGDSSAIDYVTIERNRFGVARYTDTQGGTHVDLQSSTNDLTIRDNYFDAAPTNFIFRRGHATTAPNYERIVFSDNRVFHSQQDHNFGSVVQPLLLTYDEDGEFTDFSVTENVMEKINAGINVQMKGYGLVIADNVLRSDNLDGLILVGEPNLEVDGFAVSGNVCFGDDASGDPDLVTEPSCQLKVAGGKNGTVIGNSIRGLPDASMIDIANASRIVVGHNVVNKVEDGSQCYKLHNTNHALVSNNLCIDAGSYGFQITGTSSDLSFIGNEIVTTGTSALTTNFFKFVDGPSDVVLRDNKVRGQDLTGSFYSGLVTTLNQVGNIEATGETGWRIGSDHVTDITGDGLEVTGAGRLRAKSEITRDSEWDTASEINAMTTDTDFATVDGSENLTNKDLTASSNNFPVGGLVGFVGQGSAGGTVYLGPAVGTANSVETAVSMVLPALVASRLECKVSTPPTVGTWTMTLRDDGVDTALSCSISSSSSGVCSDTTSTVSIGDNSDVSLKAVSAGTPFGAVVQCVVGVSP